MNQYLMTFSGIAVHKIYDGPGTMTDYGWTTTFDGNGTPISAKAGNNIPISISDISLINPSDPYEISISWRQGAALGYYRLMMFITCNTSWQAVGYNPTMSVFGTSGKVIPAGDSFWNNGTASSQAFANGAWQYMTMIVDVQVTEIIDNTSDLTIQIVTGGVSIPPIITTQLTIMQMPSMQIVGH